MFNSLNRCELVIDAISAVVLVFRLIGFALRVLFAESRCAVSMTVLSTALAFAAHLAYVAFDATLATG